MLKVLEDAKNCRLAINAINLMEIAIQNMPKLQGDADKAYVQGQLDAIKQVRELLEGK